MAGLLILLNRQVAKSAKGEILDRIYRMNRIDWTTKGTKDAKDAKR